MGTDNPSGPIYLFWSGFGGLFIVWVASFIVYVRHHNCHARWCPLIGKLPVDVKGVTHQVCRIHHPHVDRRPPTAAHLRAHGRPA
ncbi:MAG: hypothetical protein ACRDXE_10450 [Acidimicrobiales bacterium]